MARKLIDTLSIIFSKKPVKELKHVTDSIDEYLNIAKEDISLLDLEYDIKTATGVWLDEWGAWFGVNRKHNEPDAEYRQRILLALARQTVTVPALQKCVSDYYNSLYGYLKYKPSDIEIHEPYVSLKKFSERGEFSGEHRYSDEEFWRYHTINIKVPESITDELRAIVQDTKAAGIKVHFTVVTSIGGDDEEIIKLYCPDNIYKNTIWYKTLSISHSVSDMVFSERGSLSGRRNIWFDRSIHDCIRADSNRYNPASRVLKLTDVEHYGDYTTFNQSLREADVHASSEDKIFHKVKTLKGLDIMIKDASDDIITRAYSTETTIGMELDILTSDGKPITADLIENTTRSVVDYTVDEVVETYEEGDEITTSEGDTLLSLFISDIDVDND